MRPSPYKIRKRKKRDSLFESAWDGSSVASELIIPRPAYDIKKRYFYIILQKHSFFYNQEISQRS
jgi:hypothetical protein